MTIQMSLFQNTSLEKVQKKLLKELIALKSKEIEEKDFNNFYGTAEQIDIQRQITDEKISIFIEKVKQSFPDVLV